jgi:D-arginine dehydrogenase
VLRADGLLGALEERDAMDIDVHALHQGWLRGARRLGTTIVLDAEFAHAARRRDGWQLALADGRTLRSTLLVNAAGAWADEVATRCGAAPIGLQPRRRSAFTFELPPAAAGATHPRRWPTVAAIDEGWYIKPDAGQLLGSPANADPVPAHDVVPEEIDIATAIHRIEADTTLRIRRPHRTWAGLRTFAPDGELVIGFDPSCRGLFWLAGQGGYGIQSAAAAAALAAALIAGDAVPEDLRAHGVDGAVMDPARWRR